MSTTRNEIGYRPHTESPCPVCKKPTRHGMRGGCYECGKVKWATGGKLIVRSEP
jgi:hypothetical protein